MATSTTKASPKLFDMNAMRRAVGRPRGALAEAGELRDVRRQVVFGTAGLRALPERNSWRHVSAAIDKEARSVVFMVSRPNSAQHKRSRLRKRALSHRLASAASHRVFTPKAPIPISRTARLRTKPQRSYTSLSHARSQQHDARRAALRRIAAGMIHQRGADAAAARTSSITSTSLRPAHSVPRKTSVAPTAVVARPGDERPTPVRLAADDGTKALECRAAERRRQRTNRRMRAWCETDRRRSTGRIVMPAGAGSPRPRGREVAPHRRETLAAAKRRAPSAAPAACRASPRERPTDPSLAGARDSDRRACRAARRRTLASCGS